MSNDGPPPLLLSVGPLPAEGEPGGGGVAGEHGQEQPTGGAHGGDTAHCDEVSIVDLSIEDEHHAKNTDVDEEPHQLNKEEDDDSVHLCITKGEAEDEEVGPGKDDAANKRPVVVA